MKLNMYKLWDEKNQLVSVELSRNELKSRGREEVCYTYNHICCTPFGEVYHPWIFISSMDERTASSVRFTRLVADGPTNRNKIHGWGYWSINRATQVIVICTITWRQKKKSCATCAISCKYIIYLAPNDLPICNEKRSKRLCATGASTCRVASLK